MAFERLLYCVRRRVPDSHRLIRSQYQPAAVGREYDGPDPIGTAFEHLLERTRLRIPDSHCLVVRSRCESAPVWRERDRRDGTCMSFEQTGIRFDGLLWHAHLGILFDIISFVIHCHLSAGREHLLLIRQSHHFGLDSVDMA